MIVSGCNPKWPGIPLQTLASTAGAYNYNVFTSITLSGNVAMVHGYALSYTQNSQGPPWQTLNLSKTILRAYNMNTGQLIWENIKDGYGFMYGANSVIANNKVFVIGGDNAMGVPPANGWVRAYQIPSAGVQGMSLLLKNRLSNQ